MGIINGLDFSKTMCKNQLKLENGKINLETRSKIDGHLWNLDFETYLTIVSIDSNISTNRNLSTIEFYVFIALPNNDIFFFFLNSPMKRWKFILINWLAIGFIGWHFFLIIFFLYKFHFSSVVWTTKKKCTKSTLLLYQRYATIKNDKRIRLH